MEALDGTSPVDDPVVRLAVLAHVAEEQGLASPGLHFQLQERELGVPSRTLRQRIQVHKEGNQTPRRHDLFHPIVLADRAHVVVRLELLSLTVLHDLQRLDHVRRHADHVGSPAFDLADMSVLTLSEVDEGRRSVLVHHLFAVLGIGVRLAESRWCHEGVQVLDLRLCEEALDQEDVWVPVHAP